MSTAQPDIAKPFDTAKELRFTAKTVFIQPDDNTTYAWLIVDGSVRQYDILPTGAQITLNIYKPGSVLALPWILGRSEINYFFEALTAVTVRRLAADEYHDYLKANPDQAFKLLERVASGLDGFFSRIVNLVGREAAPRVMNELRIEAARFPAMDEHGRPVVTLKTLQIANRTGLAPETVSRTLRELQDNKQVSKTGKTITLLS